ncbi:MAG: hypothetical protein AAF596_02005 [Planctomycetota bacterium]
MINQSFYRTIACVLAMIASASLAVAGDIDVLIAEPASGSGPTFIGSVDKGTGDGDVDPSVRVFEAGMIVEEESPGEFVWEAEEPGFFTGSVGTTPVLPSGASAASDGLTVSVFKRSFSVGGSALSDLFYWDGTGSVSFVPVGSSPAAGASFELEPEGVLLNEFDDPAVITGGLYDEHPDFLIETGGAAAEPGIYLASVEAQLQGFDLSEPIYLVFATLDPGFLGLDPSAGTTEVDEAAELLLDPAVEWVQANVVVPEPSASMLGLLAVTGVVAGRKRR